MIAEFFKSFHISTQIYDTIRRRPYTEGPPVIWHPKLSVTVHERIRQAAITAGSEGQMSFNQALSRYLNACDLMLVGLGEESLAKMHAKDFDPCERDSFLGKNMVELIDLVIQYRLNYLITPEKLMEKALFQFLKKGGNLSLKAALPDLTVIKIPGMVSRKIDTSYRKDSVGEFLLDRVISEIRWPLRARYFEALMAEMNEPAKSQFRETHTMLEALPEEAYEKVRSLNPCMYGVEMLCIEYTFAKKLKGPIENRDINLSRFLRDNKTQAELNALLKDNISEYTTAFLCTPESPAELRAAIKSMAMVYALLEAGANPDGLVYMFAKPDLREMIMSRYSRKRRSMALIRVFKKSMTPEAWALLDARNLLPMITKMSF